MSFLGPMISLGLVSNIRNITRFIYTVHLFLDSNSWRIAYSSKWSYEIHQVSPWLPVHSNQIT